MRIEDENRLEKIKSKIEEKKFSEFNNDFINAMYTLATLSLNDINKSGESIKFAVEIIKEYVSKNSSANNKVNTMFGFNDRDFLIPSFGTKGYYFFIADIKIKSIVYLLRIYNFIENWDKYNEIGKQRDSFLKLVQNTKINSVRKFFELTTDSEEFTFKQIIEGEAKIKKTETEEVEIKETEVKNDEYKKFYDSIKDFLKASDNEGRREIAKEIYEVYADRINEIENQKDILIKDMIKGIPNFGNAESIFKEESTNKNLDKEYYLFDNSMKEINFVGIQWEWLWRYERGEADLFRCVGTDEFTYCGEYNISSSESSSGRKYYQTMIKNIVAHMNTGKYKSKLASYSKNPFRDIYKYMNIKNEDETNSSNNEEYFFVIKKVSDTNSITYKAELKYGSGLKNKKEDLLGEEDEKRELPYESNKNTVTFAMIKQGATNIVRRISLLHEGKEDFKIKEISDGEERLYKVDKESDVKSFSQIIERSEEAEYGFCAEVLNNKASYTGDVRSVFRRYVNQFPEVNNIPGLQLNIVSTSDEEVVMLGNTCDAILNWQDIKELNKESNKKLNYNSCNSNHEYRLTLTVKEMLYLFYRMYKITSNKQISINIQESQNDVSGYKKYKMNGTGIYVYAEELPAEEKNENDKEDINQQKKTKDEKKYKDIVQDAIKICLTNILESCDDDTKDKVEFICSFLESSSYKQSPRYGNKVYGEEKEEFKRDQFIEFCRSYLLK